MASAEPKPTTGGVGIATVAHAQKERKTTTSMTLILFAPFSAKP
jgi:hypothetical protein